jgi:hypothetical protein
MAGSSLARQKGKRAMARRLKFTMTHLRGSQDMNLEVNVDEMTLRVDVAQLIEDILRKYCRNLRVWETLR